MAQFSRPSSRRASQNWLNNDGTLVSEVPIDETSPSDTDYIVSGTNPTNLNTNLQMNMSTVTDPAVSTGHTFRIRYGKNAASGRQIDFTISLWQQTPLTQIASWSRPNVGTLTTEAIALSAVQTDLISNYGGLYLDVVVNTVGSGAGREARISWFEFEVPDAGGGTNATVTTTVVATTTSIPVPTSVATGSTVSVPATASTSVEIPAVSIFAQVNWTIAVTTVQTPTAVPAVTIQVPRDRDFGAFYWGQSTWNGGATILGDANVLISPSQLTSVAVSGSQIDLDWDPVDGATGYDIIRDGTVVESNVQGTSYSDTGLQGETSYTYRVRARRLR